MLSGRNWGLWPAGSRQQASKLPRPRSQGNLATPGRGQDRVGWLALVVLLLGTALYFAGSGEAPNYIIIVDAGSSGTRLFAYRWRAGPDGVPQVEGILPSAAPHKVPRKALSNRRAYQRVETEPGLHTYADDAGGLEQAALGPLLAWAEAVIPRKQWEATPIFLFGTAGVRKLGAEQQEALLERVRTTLQQSHFRFEPSWARVISGEDEGVYGWIALNYLAGRLAPGGTTAGHAGTIGALDLGGSSLEVTFAAEATMGVPGVNISALGFTHLVHSHVHHHFGLDDAWERSISLLAADAVAAGEQESGGVKLVNSLPALEHPCLHRGQNLHYTRRVINADTPPVPATVELIGRPKFTACIALAERVVNDTGGCELPPCGLSVPPAWANGEFQALSGFHVVHHFFGLNPKAGLDELHKAGSKFCKLRWQEVQRKWPGELSVEQYCFRAPYVIALLTKGLGLTERQVNIGEGSVGWTLGAALSDGPRLAGTELQPQAASGRTALGLGLRAKCRQLGLLLVAAAAVLACWQQLRKAARVLHSYLSLQLARRLTRRARSGSDLVASQPATQTSLPLFSGPDSPGLAGAHWSPAFHRPGMVPGSVLGGATRDSPMHELLPSEPTSLQPAWSADDGEAASLAAMQNASYTSLNRLSGRKQSYSRRGSVTPGQLPSIPVIN